MERQPFPVCAWLSSKPDRPFGASTFVAELKLTALLILRLCEIVKEPVGSLSAAMAPMACLPGQWVVEVVRVSYYSLGLATYTMHRKRRRTRRDSMRACTREEGGGTKMDLRTKILNVSFSKGFST